LVKAELDYMHPHDAYVLYGMLLDCKRAIQEKPAVKERWARLGKGLLVGETNKQLENVAAVSLLDEGNKEQ
jgi:hypothetical protein